MNKTISHLHVFAINACSSKGVLRVGQMTFPCLLGKNGRSHSKREGDGKSPVGKWRLEVVNFRPDRMQRPKTGLTVRPLKKCDGWCDAVGHRNYNRPVRLPFQSSHEALWRDDDAYDIVITTNHNHRPRMQGCGSAIFLHVIRQGATRTEGCVALSAQHLRIVLKHCGPKTYVVI